MLVSHLVRTAAVIAMAIGAAAADATVITFDTQSVNDVASLTLQSVTFTAEGGTGLYTSTYGATPNGTVGLLGRGEGGFVPIRATFATVTNAVSIDLGDYGSDDDSLFLRLYDASDVLLATTTSFIPSTFTGMVTLSATAGGTAYAIFGGVGFGGESNVYADNFTFASVPEPASWAMMIAGFGLVGAAGRRQRARTTAA